MIYTNIFKLLVTALTSKGILVVRNRGHGLHVLVDKQFNPPYRIDREVWACLKEVPMEPMPRYTYGPFDTIIAPKILENLGTDGLAGDDVTTEVNIKT